MNIAWNRWCRNLPSGTPLSLYDNRIIPIIITDITGRCNVRIQNPYTCTTSSAPSHRRFQTCANSWIPALGPPFFFLMSSMGSSAKPDLALCLGRASPDFSVGTRLSHLVFQDWFIVFTVKVLGRVYRLCSHKKYVSIFSITNGS